MRLVPISLILGHASLQIEDGGAFPANQGDLHACLQRQQIEDAVAHCKRGTMQ